MCAGPEIALGMQVFGGLMSAEGARSEAATNKANLEYNAMVADLNAKLEDSRAEDALRIGEFEATRTKGTATRIKGTQRATAAASGIKTTSANAAVAAASVDVMAEADIAMIRENARRAAAEHEMAAVMARTEADFARAGASGISPGKSYMTSLLGSASQVAGSYYNFSRLGAFG